MFKYKHSRILQKCGVILRTEKRNILKKIQSPEEKANIPVFQYAKEDAKPASRVYSWGFAQYGALGIASYVKPKQHRSILVKQQRPARLGFAEKHDVIDIACGYGFTVFAVRSDQSPKVFGTGLNSDSQIGYQEARRDQPLEVLIQPVPIELALKTPSATKIKQVACGRAHTLILTDKEGVFSLGNNAYGQCGRRIVENEEYRGNPKIHNVSVDQVNQVTCGQDNSFFLTDQGEVYTCGWGADGQLGNGRYESESVPKKARGDIEGVKIIKLSCAGDCVLALSDKGDVYGWGNSEYGQLHTPPDEQQVNIPRRLPLANCGMVTDVASAGTMCAILNADGQVYVWGYGILGKGPEVQHSNTPTPLPLTLFGCNEFNPDVRVVRLACGLNHFAAITSEGDLFMWGRNKMACLGFGHENDQYFPLRVSIPAKVKKVSCGIDHTVVLCKSFA